MLVYWMVDVCFHVCETDFSHSKCGSLIPAIGNHDSALKVANRRDLIGVSVLDAINDV